MNRIMVIGSISTDFNVQTSVVPRIGETVSGEKFSVSFGGKGANQAIAAARLGAEVHMVGTVGHDVFAEQLIENLSNNGINVDSIEREADVESGSAHITKFNNDNSIIYIAAANEKITIARIDALKTTIKDMDYVLVQNEIPIDVVLHIIDVCYSESIPVIYNPAPAKPISQEIMDKITLFTPNESEFNRIFPELSLEEGLKKYPNKLLITLGSEGVAYHDGEQIITIPSYSVDVVDTTGAGDTFNGALAFSLANGSKLENSARFSNLAAAISIQKYGAQEGMPTAEEIENNDKFNHQWNIY